VPEEKNSNKPALPKAAFANAEDQIRVRTERFRNIYANNLNVSFSPWDLSITFGEITDKRDGQAVIEETTRVLLTREVAKVLSIILGSHIEAFEAKWGEIVIPISDAEQITIAEAQPAAEAAPPEAVS